MVCSELEGTGLDETAYPVCVLRRKFEYSCLSRHHFAAGL